MSSNVDQRIVEMEFQNGQFEKGVHTSIESLEALKKSLDFDGAEKGLANLERSTRHFSMDGLTGAIEAVSGKFSAMEIVAITALQRITNKAMDAGERLIKSLSVDQISSGFSKYTDKTKSVNTIMNATGEEIDYVNERLDKLNWFTDETSYNFTDMVSNIGKFTSAGVKLDDATTAMMGIATEAALSGQGINEASRAMYNFAQAIGAGQVKLMDWRSIENANMGTQEFKQTIIDTAVELGKLKKSEKGVIKTTKGTEVNFKNFNETLSQNWFTSEVLIESLRKYGAYAEEVYKVASEQGITAAEAMEKMGDAGMELGAKAFKAAQVARTFTDAIEATKDAVSSGWMQSFELIFGDVNESAELWTDVTNALWEVFAAGAESRNEVLKAWHDASEGGRADMLSGLYDSFEALWNIITAVKDALADIFPINFGKKLKEFSTNIKDFGSNLKKTFGITQKLVGSEERDIIEKIPNFSEEFDKTLKRGASGEGVKAMQQRLEKLGYNLGSAGVDGIFGPKTEEALKAYQEAAGQAIDGIYGEATHKSLLGAVFGTHDKVVGQEIVDVFEDELSPALQFVQTLAKGVFSVFKIGAKAVGAAFFGISKVLGAISPFTSAIGKLAGTVGTLLSNWLTGLSESDLFGGWIEKITKWLEPVTNKLNEFGASITDFFGLDQDYKSFDEFWAHIEESFKKYKTIGKLWEGAKALFNGVKETIAGLFDSFAVIDENGEKLGFFDSLVVRFGKITDVWKKIKDRLKEIGVIEKFSNAWQSIKGKFANIWLSIKETFSSIGTSIFGEEYGGFGDWFTSNLPDWVAGIADGLAGIVEKIAPYIDKIPEYIDKIKGFIASIKEKIVSLFSGKESIFGTRSPESNELKKAETGSETEAKKNPFVVGIERIANILSYVTRFLPLLAVGGGIALVIFGAIKAIKLVTGLLEAFTTARFGYEKSAETESKATAILKIAGAIALIAGAIYAIGSLDDEAFTRGAITVGVITAALVGIAIAFSKMNSKMTGIKDAGKGIMQLAIGIGIIASVMWLFGHSNFETIGKGALVVVGILAILGGFIVALNKLGGTNLNLNGLIQLSVAIGILAAIMWIAGNMNSGKAIKGLLVVATLAGILGLFAKSVSKAGGKVNMKGFLGLSIAIGILALAVARLGKMKTSELAKGLVAIGILSAIFYALSKGLSTVKIDFKPIIALVLGLVALMVAFALVINHIRDVNTAVMISFAGSLVLMIGGLTAACLAVSKLGGVGAMASGAAGIGAAFAIIAAITTAVVAGLGLINDATNGGLVDTIVSGGKVLSALTDALTPFDGILSNALLYAGMIAGTAVGAIFGPAVIGGAASISLALGAVVGIATAVVAGLGLLDSIPGAEGALSETISAGGDVLAALGGAFASFGHGFVEVVNKDITDFAASIKTVREALDGVAKDTNAEEGGTLISDIEAALGVVTEIRDYLATLTPYETNASNANLGTYTSAANQLSTDLNDFGKAVGSIRTAITGLSGETGISEEDQQIAINLAKNVHDFFKSLKPYTYTKLNQNTYFTAPEQLSTDMESFGMAIGTFKESVGKLTTEYSTLEADTTSAINIASQVHTFFAGLTAEYDELAQGDPSYTLFEQKVTDLTNNQLDGLSQAIAGYKTRLSGISESTLEEDTTKALTVVGQVSKFLVEANGLSIPSNRNPLQKIFGTQNSVEAMFEDMGILGQTMLDASGKLKGLSGEESTFSTDFEAAMGAVTVMAHFLDEVSGLNIQSDPAPVFAIFSKNTAQGTVFDSLVTLATKLRDSKDSFEGLDGESFSTGFAAAMRALNAMATFMDRVGQIREAGHLGGDVDFNTVLFPIENLSDTIADFSVVAASTDMTAFSSVVTTVATGLTDITTSMASFAELAGGDTLAGMITSTLTAFSGFSSDVSDALTDGIDGTDFSLAIADIMAEAIQAAADRVPEFESVGKNCAVGLAMGLRSGTSDVVKASSMVAKAAVDTAQKVFDQHSPSKVFSQMGMYNDMGLAKGTRHYAYAVVSAYEDMSKEAIDTTESMLSGLSVLITEDMDTTPTIRPVLDMDDFAQGIHRMDGLLFDRSVDVSTSSRLARSIGSSSSGEIATKSNSLGGMKWLANTMHEDFDALAESISNMKIVMQSGALVGEIGKDMDKYLWNQMNKEMRR